MPRYSIWIFYRDVSKKGKTASTCVIATLFTLKRVSLHNIDLRGNVLRVCFAKEDRRDEINQRQPRD